MKSDVQLFSRMYISCQSREGDLETFFSHENHPWPPSLAKNNTMYLGNKAGLMDCLEALAEHPQSVPTVDMKVIDGAALVHTLDPKRTLTSVKTFGDYANDIFLPHIIRQLQTVTRVDVVWDVYSSGSLKTNVRECRGEGEALRVESKTRIPSNWKTFLRVNSNKTGLFNFLALEMKSYIPPEGKLLLTTSEKHVLSTPQSDVSQIEPCTQEEADGRMLLHVAHGYNRGYRKVMIYATDTDVVVLAIAASGVLLGCEIWLAFGHGNSFRYISAHTIATRLGKDYSQGLLFLHALSGCDTVSAFCGIGKKTAWEVWRSMPHLVPIFKRLSQPLSKIDDKYLDELERFVILLYCRTSPLHKINEARKYLFANGNRQLENIPPTREALVQHIRRAAYQAGHIWGQMLLPNPNVPSPTGWGWVKEEQKWFPLWSTLPEAAKACRELVKCNCKRSSCTGRCKCYRGNLPCTQLCACHGQCSGK